MQPKLRIFSDGTHTYAEICGKSIGKGVSSVMYSHDAPNGGKLKLEIDLEDFGFMEKILEKTAQDSQSLAVATMTLM